MAVVCLIQGNTKPRISFTLKDPDGVAINLTDATVRLFMRLIGAKALTVNAECTLDVAANGTCYYQWLGDDLDTVGSYHAELQATFSDGRIQSSNIMGLQVRPALVS